MNRRRFVSLLAASAPAALAQACAGKKSPLAAQKIIIVGAGAAGLAAATYALELGAEVVLLEAAAQAGGRVRSIWDWTNYPVELGAEEIHGERSDLYAAAEAVDAGFVAGGEETDAYYDGLTLLSEEVALAREDFIAAEAAAEAIFDEGDAPGQTVEAYFAAAGVGRGPARTLEAWFGNEYGASNAELAVNDLVAGDEAWTAGNRNFLMSDTSMTELLEWELDRAFRHLRTGVVVTAIAETADGVEVSTASGERITGSQVVVTIPLTQLKAGAITFDPPLADARLAAIRTVGMDAGMKIILRFSRRFWEAGTGSIYGGPTIAEFWTTGFGRGDDDALTAFVMGPDAARLSAMGEAGAVAAALAELDLLYGDGVASGVYVDHLYQDWTTEPYIGGAYSFPSPGSHAARAALAAPHGDRVYFAGEHTHTGGHFATVHGAIETGYKAIDQLWNRT